MIANNRKDRRKSATVADRRYRSWAAAVLALFVFGSWASGQAPPLATQTISLPTGPGSIDGLGESFEPQLNTGSYVFHLPFKLPPVRGKAQPEVSMVYNSGNGNGPLGLGWSLRVPSIQRQTDKGLPNYDATDRFITGDGEELAARSDGTFRRKVETDFTKWENLGVNGWRATKRDGTVMRFGATLQSRQERTAGQAFRWMLESCEDTNGNRVEYSYEKHQGQIYLAEIRYGLHATEASGFFRIAFAYDELRPDKLSDYRGRFKVTTSKRLRSVTVYLGERRVRHWSLDYHPNRPLTQLAKFTVFGDERTETGAGASINEDYLPPVEFDYSPSELGTNVGWNTAGPFLNVSLAQGEGRLVDLNRDGLPDLLLEDNGIYASALNRGPGRNFGALTDFTTTAFYPSLNDPATRLADLRGDGTLKVLVDDGGGVYFREFTSATTLGPVVDFTLPGAFPLDDPAIQTVDIDNDRAMDFMAADGGDRFSFIISGGGDTPNAFFEGPPTPVAANVSFADGWQLADMNGDRMPDLAVIDTVQGGGVVFYPGMGFGQFDAAITMSGGPVDGDLGPRGRAGLSLVDLDGDGLSDLVLVESGIVKIWPNRSGAAWGAPVVIDTDDVPFFNVGGTAVQFLDMNGNGSTDIVWNDPGEGIFLKYLDLHPTTKPNVMIRMRNGMGRELEIEYRSSTDYLLEAEAAGNPWTSKLPFPVPVVSAFTERDGFGSTYRTEVSYRNGYYDGPEREFRGFERAIQTEVGNAAQGAPSLVSEFVFATGATVEALKGVVLSSELRTTDGKVFHRVETEWDHRPVPGTPAAGDGRPSIFAFQEQETTTVIEGGAETPVTLQKEFSFDDYGNQTLMADYGRVKGTNRGAWGDERIVRRTFSASYPANVAKWMLDYPITEITEALDGSKAAETRYFYDDETFSGGNAGVLSRGNATLVRKLVDPTSGRFLNAERKTFDAFGNPVHLLDPLGTSPGAPHSRTIAYDPTLHTHPVSETIHIGGSVASVTLEADYDLGLGVLTESEDFNDHVTFYRYDPFARISSITKPGDTLESPTESYDYRLGMPISGGRTINWIETRQREKEGGGTVDSRMFFDGLSRKIMRRAEGEEPGQVVVTDTVVFNDRRTEWKTYLPYFATGTLDFSDSTFETPFQEKHYDALGRPTFTYQPDTGNGRAFAKNTYGPLSRLQQDEEQTHAGSRHFGAGMRYIEDGLRDKDGKGRLRTVEEIVKVDEAGEFSETTRTWTTRYRYDTLDNFTGYTDSQDTEKHFLYDSLSRRVFMDDPDRGHYWWAYDDAGNVIRTCDAKNQHLAFTYDGANRISAEWHLAPGTGGASPLPGTIWNNPPSEPTTVPDVAYHYDAAVGALAREAFWRPREAEGLAKTVLGTLEPTALADVNGDGTVDARDIALRSSSAPSAGSIQSANTLGRLAWVRDQSGEEHLSYDARGRAVWKLKRFQTPGETEMLSFFVENAFDSMDRLTRHVYADGTHIDYHYNTRGLLESVASAIDQVDYNPAGQNLRIDLANGVRTSFGYDERLRVETIASVRTRDGLAMQSREFGYDDVSNITRIGDLRTPAHRSGLLSELPVPPTLTATDLDDSYTFTYDSLYRVTDADGPSHGRHEYRFDPIGNLTRQTHTGDPRFTPPDTGTLRYGENGYGPHVLSSLTGSGPVRNFSYDSNGNMTASGDGAVMTWDPKDRLSTATEAGVEHLHTYDYASKRTIHSVTKDGSTRRTYYIDDVSEFRDGRLVKYIYVGSEKVARSEFSGQPSEAIVPDLFYLHDHLGSTTVAMDPAGNARQLSSYSPYGHNRFKGLQGSKAIDYGFSGKELHEGPDLSYFETRFLSSGLARFNQTDTLTLNPPEDWRMSPQKWHPYSYCGGNPIGRMDKDGRKYVEMVEGGGGNPKGMVFEAGVSKLTKGAAIIAIGAGTILAAPVVLTGGAIVAATSIGAGLLVPGIMETAGGGALMLQAESIKTDIQAKKAIQSVEIGIAIGSSSDLFSLGSSISRSFEYSAKEKGDYSMQKTYESIGVVWSMGQAGSGMLGILHGGGSADRIEGAYDMISGSVGVTQDMTSKK
jgi:RHS repeat-associated protein